MKVNGIIAEYNPFHNGHSYHMSHAKQSTGADYTIIAMSGNFVQRGAPALINKYKRAEMALQNGADLVLELPVYYSTSSAEYFAEGAIALLDKLGVITELCFGSECGDIAILQKIADILLTEPSAYVDVLKNHMRLGLSYPSARNAALIHYDPSLIAYKDVLSSPNNILGIAYLKALKRRESHIQPFTTRRVGADYHDKRLGEMQASALAIRQAVMSAVDTEYLRNQMPENAYSILAECLNQRCFLENDAFSSMLHYKLLTEAEKGYEEYLDVSPELSDRIRNNLEQFRSFQDFCDLLKRKDMTYTRISRCLLHILLNMKTSTMEKYVSMDYVPYVRVLGFRKDAAPLLTAIKEHSSIPIISKLADAEQILTPDAYGMLKDDILINNIYESAMSLKSGHPMQNEYRTPIVIV